MYYKKWAEMYRQASKANRAASKAHWIKTHRENIQSGREDLIMFSASILAEIALIESEEEEA